METKEKTARMTEIDFFIGIFAALSSRDRKTLLFNDSFERAMERVFRELTDYAKKKGVELRFRIRLHPFHGDSQTIYRGILTAAQMGIIALDSPGNRIIRIRLTKERANAILGHVTGGKLFIEFTDRIIDIFSH